MKSLQEIFYPQLIKDSCTELYWVLNTPGDEPTLQVIKLNQDEPVCLDAYMAGYTYLGMVTNSFPGYRNLPVFESKGQ